MQLRNCRIMVIALTAGAVAVSFAGCGSSGDSGTVVKNLKAGTYGGDSVELDVSAAGAQTMKVECGLGTLDKPIQPNLLGAFSTTGKYLTGGAVPIDGGVSTFTGVVSGDVIHLSITRSGASSPIKVVDLTYNTTLVSSGVPCPP